METPGRVKENSFEFESYVSAFCASPQPSRFEEMSLIKKMIDEDKIPLLKAVVVEVAKVSDTQERSPVFQKLAEKFGILPRSLEEEVKPKIEISVTKQEHPDIMTTNVLQEFPVDHEVKPNSVKILVPPESKPILHEDEVFKMSMGPSSVVSVQPGQPSFIHHIEVASYLKSEFEQELPNKLEEYGQNLASHNQSVSQRDPLTTDISRRSSVVVPNPTKCQVSHSSTISLMGTTSTPNSCYVSSWKLSPPTAPEISSPSLSAAKSSSQSLICATKLLPPATPPHASAHVTETDHNQMLLVDPATFLPLHENNASINIVDICVAEDDLKLDKVNVEECNIMSVSSLAERSSQPQEKSLKAKHRGTEHWIVGISSHPKQTEIQFSCEVSSKAFDYQNDVSNLKGHKVHTLGKNPLNTSMARDRLKTVISLVKGVLFACAQCGRKCKSKKSLEKHIGRAHNVKSTVPCPENCGKMLTSRAAIKKHLLSHRPPSEWPVSCPLCHKRFQARADIPKHLLTAKHRDENLPEVGSAGWWALVCWDRPELIPMMGRKRKQGR